MKSKWHKFIERGPQNSIHLSFKRSLLSHLPSTWLARSMGRMFLAPWWYLCRTAVFNIGLPNHPFSHYRHPKSKVVNRNVIVISVLRFFLCIKLIWFWKSMNFLYVFYLYCLLFQLVTVSIHNLIVTLLKIYSKSFPWKHLWNSVENR